MDQQPMFGFVVQVVRLWHTFRWVHLGRCQQALLVADLKLLLVQQLREIGNQLILMLALCANEVFELSAQLLDCIFANAVALCQGRQLLFEAITLGYGDTSPVEKLNSLFIILLESYRPESLLQHSLVGRGRRRLAFA